MTRKRCRIDPGTGLRLARLACVGLLLQGLAACVPAPDPAAAGTAFPLRTLDDLPPLGESGRHYAGKTLLVNFWATWCAPCREEMPLLQRLSDRLDSSRYAVIGISVDEDANLAREFLLRHGIRFPVYQDAAGRRLAAPLGLLAYPQTYLVTPDGTILRRIDEAIGFDPDRPAGAPGRQAGLRGAPPRPAYGG